MEVVVEELEGTFNPPRPQLFPAGMMEQQSSLELITVDFPDFAAAVAVAAADVVAVHDNQSLAGLMGAFSGGGESYIPHHHLQDFSISFMHDAAGGFSPAEQQQHSSCIKSPPPDIAECVSSTPEHRRRQGSGSKGARKRKAKEGPVDVDTVSSRHSISNNLQLEEQLPKRRGRSNVSRMMTRGRRSGGRGSNYKAGGKKDAAEEEEEEEEVVHVRARRGQATDSHSLAERVRREKINERMRCLQDLVPGCYKAMGMAVMLDEIINYLQSLQNQVEFLSMKLSAASAFYDFNLDMEAIAAEPPPQAAAAPREMDLLVRGSSVGYCGGGGYCGGSFDVDDGSAMPF